MKKRSLLSLTVMLLLSTCMLLCVVVGLASCKESSSGEDSVGSTDKYYCFIDGERIEVSLGDVITVPTEPDDKIEDGYEFIGWEVGKQTFKPGESITLEPSMFYPSGGIGDSESIIYTYDLSYNPIITEIVRPVYFHYFEDKTLEWDEWPLMQLRARGVVNPFCLDNADVSIQWKTGNHLDGGWLFLDKYDFEGWYLDEEYTKEFWDFSDLKASGIGDEVHLYAKWTYTGILYEEYDATRWRVAEIDLSDDIEQVVIPSVYGRGKKCDYDYAGYEIIGITADAFTGTGAIGTLILQSGIELSYENFAGANIDCISLDNVSIPLWGSNSYTKVFDGYTGRLSCSESSDYEFADGILYDKNTNEILWVSNHIPGEITLRKGVTNIYTLFAGTDIEKIVLPDSVGAIENGAFKDCVNLKIVEVNGDTLISGSAFTGCVSLEYETYKGGVYMGNTLMAIQEGATLLEVKEGCKSIPASMLENNTTVTKVVLPSSVTSIGNDAFKNSAIEEIVILGRNFYFGSYAFRNCSRLKTVTMPETTRYIGYYCFENCVSLESIDLSGLSDDADPTVIVLSSGAFSGCTSLATVTMSENISELPYGTFFGCSNLQEIVLPQNIAEIGENCFNNCTSLKTISIPGVTSLGAGCFSGCSSLETIELPRTVTALPENCFAYCYSLTSVSMPGVTALPENCFANLTSLTSVSMPAVTSLGAGCFSGCSSLKTIELPQTVTALPENCFANLTSLTSVSMPAVTSLGAGCFSGCSSLKTIELPQTVTALPENCFMGCTALSSVVLPTTLTVINNGCFDYCSNLEYVFYLGNYKQWGYVNNKCSDIATKVYFYSAEVQTVENYIETRKACWGYDENNVPTAWIVPTNHLDGKTFAMSNVSVTVSDYYWNMIVSLKANDMLENAFGSDQDLYNAANTATTKQEFADNLGIYYYNKYSSHKLSFQNGIVTTSQNGIDNVRQYSYLEINGEIVYSPEVDGTYYIVSDTQIYETQEGERVSGNDTLTMTFYYSLVA